ncbi:amino acid adenylation domain-containing protein [Pseudoalteromonas sp. S16_S37]|uniref:amino acid adenylation domain-containing protein n=1 Tax=Pseudoalteromonas sp. S16_S37 TaxID=2720228 RepID=UPI001680DF1D|nr:amino acid adenylation domain-containing protein [Pseudoalteromonas sp. S16_S37]MBD1583323.1 amino acid adenylation domain-containing protein [Pseudoalteromonas sp. S16_S37]
MAQSNIKLIDKLSTYSLATLIQKQSLESPNRIAINLNNDSVTFDELSTQIQEGALYLSHQGITTGSVVAFCANRSIEMIVLMLSLNKIGAVIIPIDPLYPNERIEYMINDAGVSHVLSDSKSFEMLCAKHIKVLDVQNAYRASQKEWNNQSASGVANICFRPYVDSPVYILYTSGSSGKPKGVIVRHGSLENVVSSVSRRIGFTQSDRLAAITPMSFDIAFLEILMPLYNGATLYLFDDKATRDLSRLQTQLVYFQINVLQTTPSLWHLILQTGWKPPAGFKALCGGEPLSNSLAQSLLRHGAQLYNLYGPTETTIWSTLARIFDKVHIGKPIANTQIYIVDTNTKPLPVGEVGEICIAGRGLALGYLNQPQLTAQKFVYSNIVKSGRLYKTGDLGYKLPDGNFCILGRLDEQVKVNGYRVELDEIATLINDSGLVWDSVVIGAKSQNLQTQIVAFLRSKSGYDEELLRQQLLKQLPVFMLPSRFVLVDKLPLTTNGKTDLSALRALLLTMPQRSKNKQNAIVAWLLQQLVELEVNPQICDETNFFHQGLSSFSGHLIVQRIKVGLNIDVPLLSIYKYPSLKALSRYIAQQIFSQKSLIGVEVILSLIAAQDNKGTSNRWSSSLHILESLNATFALDISEQEIVHFEHLEEVAQFVLNTGLAMYRFLNNLNYQVLRLNQEPRGSNEPMCESILRRKLSQSLAKHNIPGAAIALFLPEQTFFAVAGMANLETQIPVTLQTRFRIGCIAKVITGAVVMDFVIKGLLQLDTPIKYYVPEFKIKCSEYASQITMRHLLSHTSGIDESSIRKRSFSGLDGIQKHMQFTSNLSSYFQPGKGASYTDVEFIIAAAIIEQISGKFWHEIVGDFMQRYGLVEHTGNDVAVGYQTDSGSVFRRSSAADVEQLSSLNPFDGIQIPMNIQSLAKFVQLFLNSHKGKQGEWFDVEQMCTVQAEYQGHLDWNKLGLSLFHYRDGMLGRAGSSFGHESIIKFDRKRNIGVAFLANQLPSLAVAHEILADVFPKYNQLKYKKELNDFSIYVGEYFNDASSIVVFENERNELMIKKNEGGEVVTAKLEYLGSEHFYNVQSRCKNVSGVLSFFFKNKSNINCADFLSHRMVTFKRLLK